MKICYLKWQIILCNFIKKETLCKMALSQKLQIYWAEWVHLAIRMMLWMKYYMSVLLDLNSKNLVKFKENMICILYILVSQVLQDYHHKQPSIIQALRQSCIIYSVQFKKFPKMILKDIQFYFKLWSRTYLASKTYGFVLQHLLHSKEITKICHQWVPISQSSLMI